MKLLTFIFLFLSFQIMAETDFEKAEKLFQQQKWEQSKVLFENDLKSNPNKSKTIEYLGDIAGHQKKWDEAINKYKILKNQFPNSANYYYKFGGALGMKAKTVSKFKALGMISDIELHEMLVRTELEQVPDALTLRLEPGGILIAPVGPHQGVQTLVRLTRSDSGFERKALVDVRFVPALPGIAREL